MPNGKISLINFVQVKLNFKGNKKLLLQSTYSKVNRPSKNLQSHVIKKEQASCADGPG